MIQDKIRGVSKQIYEIAGREFDIDSETELAKVLFDEIGLPQVNVGLDDRSVADLALYPLYDTHRIIPMIWEYRNLKIAEKIPANATLIEQDGFGRIVGWGTHETYGTYDIEVQNGEGYYDDNGRYRPYVHGD